MTPAPTQGPHLPGPAFPPAAVRAGIFGKFSETNDFLFSSWLLVHMSKSVHSPFVIYLLTVNGGYRDHRKRSVLKKRGLGCVRLPTEKTTNKEGLSSVERRCVNMSNEYFPV